jgi:thioredoxin reductase (NADPH)
MTDCDVLVAGSGIAGLSVALTAARLGRKTLLLTGDVLGGQLLSIAKVDGYPGFPDGIPGFDLCPIAQEQAMAAGAELRMADLASLAREGRLWRTTGSDGSEVAARAVVLATGARLRTLGVPGEARLFGKGVSHCASCDAPLLRGKVAVVVGGGDSALQEALTLAGAAVARVHVLHRGPHPVAQHAYRDAAAAEPKIAFSPETEVAEILGASAVEGVRTAKGETIAAAAVFVFVGLAANGALAPEPVRDKAGAIVTDAAMRTALPGLCAAGAVRALWPGRAAAAAGEGAAAAIAIDRYLRDDAWQEA